LKSTKDFLDTMLKEIKELFWILINFITKLNKRV
jgi:hypothetical protein